MSLSMAILISERSNGVSRPRVLFVSLAVVMGGGDVSGSGNIEFPMVMPLPLPPFDRSLAKVTLIQIKYSQVYYNYIHYTLPK